MTFTGVTVLFRIKYLLKLEKMQFSFRFFLSLRSGLNLKTFNSLFKVTLSLYIMFMFMLKIALSSCHKIFAKLFRMYWSTILNLSKRHFSTCEFFLKMNVFREVKGLIQIFVDF